MSNAHRKPSWLWLYAIVPLVIGLLLAEAQFGLPEVAHKLVQFGIVVLGVGLMGLWVATNAAALEWDDIEQTSEWQNRMALSSRRAVSPLSGRTATAVSESASAAAAGQGARAR